MQPKSVRFRAVGGLRWLLLSLAWSYYLGFTDSWLQSTLFCGAAGTAIWWPRIMPRIGAGLARLGLADTQYQLHCLALQFNWIGLVSAIAAYFTHEAPWAGISGYVVLAAASGYWKLWNTQVTGSSEKESLARTHLRGSPCAINPPLASIFIAFSVAAVVAILLLCMSLHVSAFGFGFLWPTALTYIFIAWGIVNARTSIGLSNHSNQSPGDRASAGLGKRIATTTGSLFLLVVVAPTLLLFGLLQLLIVAGSYGGFSW